MTAENVPVVAGRRGASFNDTGHATTVDRLEPDDGEGEGALSFTAGGRRLYPPKDRTFFDPGGILPASQSAHGAE